MANDSCTIMILAHGKMSRLQQGEDLLYQQANLPKTILEDSLIDSYNLCYISSPTDTLDRTLPNVILYYLNKNMYPCKSLGDDIEKIKPISFINKINSSQQEYLQRTARAEHRLSDGTKDYLDSTTVLLPDQLEPKDSYISFPVSNFTAVIKTNLQPVYERYFVDHPLVVKPLDNNIDGFYYANIGYLNIYIKQEHISDRLNKIVKTQKLKQNLLELEQELNKLKDELIQSLNTYVDKPEIVLSEQEAQAIFDIYEILTEPNIKSIEEKMEYLVNTIRLRLIEVSQSYSEDLDILVNKLKNYVDINKKLDSYIKSYSELNEYKMIDPKTDVLYFSNTDLIFFTIIKQPDNWQGVHLYWSSFLKSLKKFFTIFIYNDNKSQWEIKYAGFFTFSITFNAMYKYFKDVVDPNKLRILIPADNSNVIYGACRSPADAVPIKDQNGQWVMSNVPDVPEILYHSF